jgi:hypothetical protein
LKLQAIAQQEYQAGPKLPSPYAWLLAGGGFVIVLLFCFLKSHSHPPINTSLSSAAPAPGMPVTISGLTQTEDSEPPFEADVGSFSITQLPSKPIPEAKRKAGKVTLLLPIPSSSCKPLRRVLGGRCEGEAPVPSGEPEGIEVKPLRPSTAMSMQLQPKDGNVVQLTQSTPATEQPIPTAWAVRTDAAETEVTFGCATPMPLLVAVPPHRQRVMCAPGKAVFRLAVQPRRPTAPIIFINDVGRIEANLNGRKARVGVLHGALHVGDNQPALEEGKGGAQVEIASDRQSGVDAVLEDSDRSKVASLTFSSKEASTVTVGGVNQIPSWLDRHEGLHYLLLGLAGGALAATLIDYLAKRRGARRR